MHIVIDIDEALYKYMQSRYKYQNKGDEGLSTAEEAGIAIKNGTLLPKGHGKLGDLGALSDYFWNNRSKLYTHKDLQIVLDNVDTIIPADTESEEEDGNTEIHN